MTIEFENFDDLKEQLDAMGWYLTKKVSNGVGKLNNCSKCGRKMFAYNASTHWEYQTDDKEEIYIATYCVGEVKCFCGNKVVVRNDDIKGESSAINRSIARKDAVKKWNEAN